MVLEIPEVSQEIAIDTHMLNGSRLGIYNYVYDRIYDVVTRNVYSMFEPQELTSSDATDGFVVIRVGDVVDRSEFMGEAFAQARVWVEAYVPLKSRGRLDKNKYAAFEDALDDVVRGMIQSDGDDTTYGVEDDGVLSMDTDERANANNAFALYVKSFVVTINNP